MLYLRAFAVVLAAVVGCAAGQGGPAGRGDGGAQAPDAGASDPFVDAGDGDAPVCEASCVFPVADHVDLGHPVWGEQGVHYYVPHPAWAMAATQGSRLLAYYLGGSLDRTVSPNWFLATALKESYLGCCTAVPADAAHPAARWEHTPASVGDGCFQIENGTAFVEMQRIFPAHYAAASHADVIAGCRVESSAVTMAFYDAFVFGMMHKLLGDPGAFFAAATDPGAVELAFSIAYNRGVWSQELAQAIGPCAAAADLLQCVFGDADTIARDHAFAIWQYVQDLDAAAREGRCYDAALTSADVAAYVDAIAPVLAPGDPAGLRDRAVAAFEAAAGGASGTFQAHFGAVLAVLEAEPVQDPFPQLADWYAVPGPGPVFTWPAIEATCDSVGPIP